MKIAVTGGAGQLGTLVLRKLATDRKITTIRALDLRPPLVANRKIEAVQADVRDPDFARHIEGFDALVHLAFIVAPWAPRPVMDAVNVEGSKNVFAAAAAASIKAIVYTSSVAAYGVVPGHPSPIVESSPRLNQPDFAYAANKFAVEALLDAFEAEHPDIAVARLRPGILLGARMEHAIGNAFQARLLPDLGGLRVPMVWDEDVAAAVALCLQARARGAFNLVAESSSTPAELAQAGGLRRLPIPAAARHALGELVERLARLGVTPPLDPRWLTLDLPELVFSSEKARQELGWAPQCPTASDVVRRVSASIRGRPDPRITVFFKLAAVAAKRLPPREEERTSVAIHLEITGPGGADYTLRFTRGTLSIEPGIPRPPGSVLSIRKSVLLDLLAGRLTPATAEITGKFRVEGEPLASMTLTALVSLFRAQVHQPGPGGFAARKFADWLARP